MADVDISELDATDLGDILTEIKGSPTKVKNAAAARKELEGLLDAKSLVLTTDDEGNFMLNAKKPAKGKVKAKAPEPEEEPEEEEAEEEPEEEAEEEAEPEPEPEPAPKKKVAAKPAPAPAPKSKVKAKAPEPEEEEEEVAEEPEEEAEEEEAPPPKKSVKSAAKAPAKDGAKRAPPPREPSHSDSAKITIVEKDRKFKDGSIRFELWAVMKKSKTVGDFMKRGAEHERDDVKATTRGFLNVAVKDGWISVA